MPRPAGAVPAAAGASGGAGAGDPTLQEGEQRPEPTEGGEREEQGGAQVGLELGEQVGGEERRGGWRAGTGRGEVEDLRGEVGGGLELGEGRGVGEE